MLIQDTRAIVSGGASGLGLAVAELVVAAGGKVALFDVNDQAGVAAVHRLGAAASFHKVDVTAESAVTAAVAAATTAMGRLNLAVSCAGVGWPKRMVGKEGTMPGDFFRKVIEINLIGTLLLCKEAAAAMQQNTPNAAGERGALVMTASVAAFDGQIGQVAYAASKGGVVGMTLPMAPEEARDSLGKQVPFPPRLGQPSEYAQLVGQIVENPMLNGETIRLDGAIRMAPR